MTSIGNPKITPHQFCQLNTKTLIPGYSTIMATYQTEAIILKRENVGEADRSYIIYSKDFGKLRVSAQGVRKITAKLTGHLEPFNLAWLELVTKRNGRVTITTALSSGRLFGNGLPAQIALAAKIADFIDKMVPQPQKDAEIWDFICRIFVSVNDVSVGERVAFFEKFRGEFLEFLGYGDNFEAAWHYLGDFF
ncbi:hypothetical protein A2608_00360 [Candidatus Azambacteria bacterium RIFOXYD1_FULL_44_10]|nr:MAG: hypothetical protein A2608_00360 [Candidatus Azambacteria bacterium RIFOXYD1_FULL_44_10]